MYLHGTVSEALFKGLFFMLAGLPCFQTQDLPSFCCTSLFGCVEIPVMKPLWQSAVIHEDCDGAASSICEVLLALPLASWAEALQGWAVRWFFWPHQETLEPSQPADVLYQADFSCAVTPDDLSRSVTLLWKKISVLRCFSVSRVLNIKNLACWRLDEPKDFLTPLVAGVSWKGRRDLGCCSLCPWWCLWGEHGYKNFSSARVDTLAYGRMLEMLSWKVHWIVFLFD